MSWGLNSNIFDCINIFLPESGAQRWHPLVEQSQHDKKRERLGTTEPQATISFPSWWSNDFGSFEQKRGVQGFCNVWSSIVCLLLMTVRALVNLPP